MGIRIIEDTAYGCVLVDTTTGEAFGPLFDQAEDIEIVGFISDLPKDPRSYSTEELRSRWEEWCERRDD